MSGQYCVVHIERSILSDPYLLFHIYCPILFSCKRKLALDLEKFRRIQWEVYSWFTVHYSFLIQFPIQKRSSFPVHGSLFIPYSQITKLRAKYRKKLYLHVPSNCCCSIHIDFILIVPYELFHINCFILIAPYCVFHIDCLILIVFHIACSIFSVTYLVSHIQCPILSVPY